MVICFVEVALAYCRHRKLYAEGLRLKGIGEFSGLGLAFPSGNRPPGWARRFEELSCSEFAFPLPNILQILGQGTVKQGKRGTYKGEVHKLSIRSCIPRYHCYVSSIKNQPQIFHQSASFSQSTNIHIMFSVQKPL
jgi:hypothetical protein